MTDDDAMDVPDLVLAAGRSIPAGTPDMGALHRRYRRRRQTRTGLLALGVLLAGGLGIGAVARSDTVGTQRLLPAAPVSTAPAPAEPSTSPAPSASPSASAPPSPPRTVPPASTSAPAGPTSAAASTRSATSPTAAVAPASPAVGVCRADQLEPRTNSPDGAAGHDQTVVVLRNTAATACTTDGYSGLVFSDAGGVEAVDVRHGDTYFVKDPGPTLLTVAPGADVSFAVGYLEGGPGPCQRPTSLTLTPPGQVGSRSLPVSSFLICGGSVDETALVGGSAGPASSS